MSWTILQIPSLWQRWVGLLICSTLGSLALAEAYLLIPQEVRPQKRLLLGTALLMWLCTSYQGFALGLISSVILSLAALAPLIRVQPLVWGGFLIPYVWVILPFAAALLIWTGSLQGPAWVLSSVICVKGADIAAFLGGTFFGRHPLAPNWSPKKTIEGLISALAIGTGLGWTTFGYGLGLPLWSALSVGAILSVAGALGDLLESGFKRAAGVKDSGLLAGLGGVLDIVDALLVAWPILLLLHMFLQ